MTYSLNNILQTQKVLLDRQSLSFKRFLYNKIDFSQRLVGIVGPRGVGKTTLILQYLKENFYEKNSDEAVYIVADDVLFEKGDLSSIARDLHISHGITTICIDEIHRFVNWNQELKNIYDSYPDLRIIFSGSSSIDLTKGKYDLSRRGALYTLPGFSFREFLKFYKDIDLPIVSVKQIITKPSSTIKKVGTEYPVLKFFKEYLQYGYYPFYNETKDKILYNSQILNTIDKIVYEDVASVYKLKTNNLLTFKQILYFFATITPGELSINKLASSLKRGHATIAEYLEILRDAGLVRFLTNDRVGHVFVRHAEKIYLDNSNLLYAISKSVGKRFDIGMARELFFLNQLQNIGEVPCYTKKGDFIINDIVFEIGGKTKSQKQIKNIKNSFILQDNTLVSTKKSLPLYLFGFLY